MAALHRAGWDRGQGNSRGRDSERGLDKLHERRLPVVAEENRPREGDRVWCVRASLHAYRGRPRTPRGAGDSTHSQVWRRPPRLLEMQEGAAKPHESPQHEGDEGVVARDPDDHGAARRCKAHEDGGAAVLAAAQDLELDLCQQPVGHQ